MSARRWRAHPPRSGITVSKALSTIQNTIDATAKVAAPGMLAAMILRRSITEPCAISATFQSTGMLSASCASKTAAADGMQAIRGFTP